MLDSESKEKALGELRTIVQKVEQKAHIPPDHPDVVALRRIVEHRIIELESDDGFERSSEAEQNKRVN